MSGGQCCWLRRLSVSGPGEGARPRRTGTPAASATACRWRAWLSHLLFPRNPHVYRREREENKETLQLPTSRPRLHPAHHCCAPISFAQESRRVTDALGRCRSCVSERTCLRHATTTWCRRPRLWHVLPGARRDPCQVGKGSRGRMKADAI